MPLHFNLTHFLLLATCTLLIMAGGYIINDLFDVEKDRINKPDQVIIGRSIGQKKAKSVYNILNATAILLVLLVTYQLKNPGLGTLLLGSIYLLHLYSKYLQRTIAFGNLSIATLCALSIWVIMVGGQTDLLRASTLSGLSTEMYFWIFGGFAFLTTFWRELVKDMEDVEGDAQAGIRTMAHLADGQVSKYFGKLIGLVLSMNIAMILWLFWPTYNPYGKIYGILLLGTSCFITLNIFPANKKKEWSRISLWQKAFIIQGILFINFWHGAY